MSTTREIIAKQVKEARKKKRLTQLKVAQEADTSVTYFAMIERGDEKANASSEKLAKIGKALGITIKI